MGDNRNSQFNLLTKEQKTRLGADYGRGQVRDAVLAISAETGISPGNLNAYRSYIRKGMPVPRHCGRKDNRNDGEIPQFTDAERRMLKEDEGYVPPLHLLKLPPEKFIKAVSRILEGE